MRWCASFNPRIVWFLRGIRPSGEYYGEVRSHFDRPRPIDQASGIIRTVSGMLSSHDADELYRLAAELRSYAWNDGDKVCRGIIADGPISRPTILFRYYDDATDNELGKRFLEITQILNPYFTPLYSSLTENSKLAD
jgi:hypothetical protein